MKNMPDRDRSRLGELSYSFTDEEGRRISGKVDLDSNESLTPEVAAFLLKAATSLDEITPEKLMGGQEQKGVPFTEYVNGTTTEGRMTPEQMAAVDDGIVRFLLDAIVLLPETKIAELPEDTVVISRRGFTLTDAEALPRQSPGK